MKTKINKSQLIAELQRMPALFDEVANCQRCVSRTRARDLADHVRAKLKRMGLLLAATMMAGITAVEAQVPPSPRPTTDGVPSNAVFYPGPDCLSWNASPAPGVPYFVINGQPGYYTMVSTNLVGAQTIVIGTNIYKLWTPPKAQAAVTNIVVSWNAYTNTWFQIDGSTNLADTNGWYFVTNVPCWRTNVTIVATKPQEFFRVSTIYTP